MSYYIGNCYNVLHVDKQNINISSRVAIGNFPFRIADPEPWCTMPGDARNWIALTFSMVHKITAFSLGGNTNISTVSFVKKFNVSLQEYREKDWEAVRIGGAIEVS